MQMQGLFLLLLVFGCRGLVPALDRFDDLRRERFTQDRDNLCYGAVLSDGKHLHSFGTFHVPVQDHECDGFNPASSAGSLTTTFFALASPCSESKAVPCDRNQGLVTEINGCPQDVF